MQTTVGGTITTVIYNAAGQRVSEWNGANPWSSPIQSKYYWGGKPVAYYANGSTHFEHQDWLGTERMRTTYNGAMEGWYTSLPFGDGQGVSGVDGDANHYATLDHDAQTNTDYAQFRQYSNAQGRWLSPDPYHGSYKKRNPQSFNRYVYAGNNPLGFVDPTGLQLCGNFCSYNHSGSGDGDDGPAVLYPGTTETSDNESGDKNLGDETGGSNSNDGTGSDGGGSDGGGDQTGGGNSADEGGASTVSTNNGVNTSASTDQGNSLAASPDQDTNGTDNSDNNNSLNINSINGDNLTNNVTNNSQNNQQSDLNSLGQFYKNVLNVILFQSDPPATGTPCQALAVGSVPLAAAGVPQVAAGLGLSAAASSAVGWAGLAGAVAGVGCAF